MAEENVAVEVIRWDVKIRKVELGFLVRGDKYSSGQLRAFSTVEGLIEWLSRELGAGPIVWAWTLPIWGEMVGVEEKDLLPMPDLSADPSGYHEAQEYNATFLITRFAEKVIEARTPKPPPEPKPKKGKEVKEEKPVEEVKEEKP